MSKTKKSEQNHYEMLFIIPNKFTDDEAKKVVTKVEEIISENGGEITYREYWGKKKLAYSIKHNHYGYYSLCEFNLDRASLNKIDNTLRLSGDVLRHQVIAQAALTDEERARAKSLSEKLAVKKEDSSKKPTKATETSEKENETSTESEPAKIEELDEKLEGILSAQDLL